MAEKEKIEIDKAVYDELMTSLRSMREFIANSSAGAATAADTVTERNRRRDRIVTVMFVNNKPVVGLANVGSAEEPVRVYELPDATDPRKMVLYVDLLLLNDDGSTERVKKVPFMDFLQNGTRRECKVVKIDKKEWEMDFGTTEQKRVEGDEYKMKEMGTEVDVIVTGVDMVYKVEIAEGRVIDLAEEYINMARATKKPMKQVISTVE